jgi:acetyltransferase-like isoleucine patch superfamily enzyme
MNPWGFLYGAFKNKVVLFKGRLIKKLHSKVSGAIGLKVLGPMPFFKLPREAKVHFGSNVILNSDIKNSNTTLTGRCKFVAGHEGQIIVGDNTMLNGVCIVAYKRVTIGKNCQIASSTLLADTDFHPVDPFEREKQVTGIPISFDHVKKAEIILGDNVWIGWNCTILKGVLIGNNSIVGAGSTVLAGCYPSNSLIAGNPAKVIKDL